MISRCRRLRRESADPADPAAVGRLISWRTGRSLTRSRRPDQKGSKGSRSGCRFPNAMAWYRVSPSGGYQLITLNSGIVFTDIFLVSSVVGFALVPGWHLLVADHRSLQPRPSLPEFLRPGHRLALAGRESCRSGGQDHPDLEGHLFREIARASSSWRSDQGTDRRLGSAGRSQANGHGAEMGTESEPC